MQGLHQEIQEQGEPTGAQNQVLSWPGKCRWPVQPCNCRWPGSYCPTADVICKQVFCASLHMGMQDGHFGLNPRWNKQTSKQISNNLSSLLCRWAWLQWELGHAPPLHTFIKNRSWFSPIQSAATYSPKYDVKSYFLNSLKPAFKAEPDSSINSTSDPNTFLKTLKPAFQT